MVEDRLIVTAASAAFGPSLLALLGSLDLNWPGHPKVVVYDIGLDEQTKTVLSTHDIPVRSVPPFCAHWRKHFSWKIWCINDAPATDVLWLDAGAVILSPIDEVFDALEKQGYFMVPNYQLLDWEASIAACEGCDVPPTFRIGKLTLAGGLMGFRKAGTIGVVVSEALRLAMIEKNIIATEPSHRHDQALISLLMYKHVRLVTLADGIVYLGWVSPNQTPGQKVWVHRRGIAEGDRKYFASRIATTGAPYRPVVVSDLTSKARTLAGTVLRRCREALAFRKERTRDIYDGVID